MGTVYLIHFDRPFGQPASDAARAERGLPPRKPGSRYAVRHYLGWTDDLANRLNDHQQGHGSALMRAVSQAGISWRLARTWAGDRKLERQLKAWKKARQLCPICRREAH